MLLICRLCEGVNRLESRGWLAIRSMDNNRLVYCHDGERVLLRATYRNSWSMLLVVRNKVSQGFSESRNGH